MNFIKNLFLGTDKKNLDNIRPEVAKSNRIHMIVLASLAATILGVLGVFATIIKEGFASNILYFFFAVASLALAVLSILNKDNKSHYSSMTCFLFMIIILMFGMVVGVTDGPDSVSTVFVVLLLAIPLLFVIQPVYVNALIVIMSITFLILDYNVKNPDAFRNDLINVISFALVSICVGSFILRAEIESFIAQYDKQLLMNQVKDQSITDALTGLNNRNAYEEQFAAHPTVPEGHDFIYVSIDLNGLKIANDTYGHYAGDELIKGAAYCMRKSFGKHGNIYRVGGDEFVVVVFVNKEEFEKLLDDFETRVSKWKGNLVEELSVAIGFASAKDYPGKSVDDLSQIADKFMYEDKNRQYKAKGIDRQGQKEAFITLCDLYTKIIRVNLDEDNFSIIDINMDEKDPEKGYSDTLSLWLKEFAQKGQVHPDDCEKFLKLTDLSYIKQYFSLRKKTLNIYYRRKVGETYKEVMMEIVPCETYTPDNPVVFFFIKEIDH